MSHPIEGIDYIFNRYAFLDLTINANEQEIKSEIRKKRAENHPDKLLRVSKEITDIATRNIDLIDQCERILLNSELKVIYDNKLKKFQKEEPHLISINGTAIIDLTKMRVDIDYLLNESITDISQLDSLALKMSGYTEKRLKRAYNEYNEEPTEENKEILRYELTNKFVYLNTIEEYYWQKAGVFNVKNKTHDYQNSTDVFKSLEYNIDSIQEKTKETIINQHGLSLLGFVKPLLLEYDKSDNEANITTEVLFNKTIDTFQERSHEVKKIIEDKQHTLEELTKVSRSKQIVKNDTMFHDFLLFETNENNETEYVFPEDNIQLLGLAFRLDLEKDTLDLFQLDLSVLTKENIDNWENNLHIVEPNREIEAPILEIVSVAKRISEQYAQLKKNQ